MDVNTIFKDLGEMVQESGAKLGIFILISKFYHQILSHFDLERFEKNECQPLA